MVHKPKHKVHSFRGLLADGGQDEINLERSNVNLAYRVVKFELITGTPGSASAQHVMQVWREEQTTATSGATIDFSDPDLLAAGLYISGDYSPAAGWGFTSDQNVIFDNVLFSRNIYVTHTENAGSVACNYYIELEEVPVGAATLMQLKLGVARKLDLKEGEYIPPA